MCGIAGWLAPTGRRPTKAVVQRMTRTLAHRGPDGEGFLADGPVVFGHRRLAIVDLAGGAQPMTTPDRALAVTFNGEIYNYHALRRELEQLGHSFTTSSDTEVLLHGYAQWREGLPARLNGMFAFAVWDRARREVFLARDRMGEKPLYWSALADGGLAFGSEAKALLQHPGVSRRGDLRAIATYLTYDYVPWPLSAFADVRKLEPGGWLRWRPDGAVEQGVFATLPFGEPSTLRSESEWVDATREALTRAVRRRLMSDVPLGVFLSGGVDSSAIVALMARHVAPRDIQTFSIAFEDPSFDESRYARQVAEHVGTTHHVRTFTADDLLALLPGLVERMDEPFADASLLPTHMLSRFAREQVTVALGGDGGDELFLGYETFRADRAAEAWRHVPGPVRALVGAGVDRMPVRTSNFSLDFVARRFLRGADACREFRHVRWLSASLPHTPDDPLLPERRAEVPDGDIFGVMADPYLACRDPDHLQRLSFAYLRTYFAEDILTKVDRASMAVGLEARAVFVDPELVSLVCRMPASLKLRGLTAKYALKRALDGLLPREIVHRKKKGFGIPVAAWLNGPLAPELDRLLAPARLRDGGLLDAGVVARLVGEHRAGVADHRKILWALMMLESWRERHDVTF